MDWPEVFVLRHGETSWNAEGRIQGRQDSSLTALGRTQAKRQGEILREAGVTSTSYRFLSSPQGRVQQTAAIALAGFGVVPTTDERLCELGMGSYEGMTRAEVEVRFPGAFLETDPFLWYDTVPDGEGFQSIQARACEFLQQLDQPSVIVTHGMLSRFLRGVLLGLDLAGIADLEGGQGVVYHLKGGRQTRLT